MQISTAHKHSNNISMQNEAHNVLPMAKKSNKRKAVISKSIGFIGLFLSTKVDVFARFSFKARRRTKRGDAYQRT